VTEARERRLAAAVLGVVLLGRLAATVWLWASGHDAISTDEFLRVNQAYLWSESPGLMPGLPWGPFYYYVYGSALVVCPDTLWTPRLLTVALSLLSVVLIYALSRRCTGSRTVSLLAAAACAFAPRSIRLGATPLAETLCLVCFLIAVLLVDEWRRTWRRRTLACAALAAAFAVATRYEAWAYAPLWIAAVVLPRAPLRERLLRAAMSLVPLAVMAWLVLFFWRTAGDPLHPFGVFAEHSARHYGTISRSGIAAALIWPLVEELPAVAPLLVAGAAIAVWRRRRPPALFTALAAGAVLTQLALALLGRLPTQFPSRLVVMPIFLLTPLAAWAVADLVRTERRRLLLGAMVVLPLAIRGALASASYPNPTRQTALAGLELRRLAARGEITSSARVVVEVKEWDYVVVVTVSGLRHEIVLDSSRLGGRPSVFLHPSLKDLMPRFRHDAVRWLMVRTPEIARRVREAFVVESSRQVAGYELLGVRP
jgi:hypothetical protein